MIVTMPEPMMRKAAHVGIERQLRALRLGRTHKWGWDGGEADGNGDWSRHIHGAAAEQAVAWLIGREWGDDPACDYDGDVGPGVQVRWTHLTNGRLMLHPEDNDDHSFILVRGRLEALDVAGWLRGREGKIDRYWRENIPHPAFLVPAADLHAMPDRRDPGSIPALPAP